MKIVYCLYSVVKDFPKYVIEIIQDFSQAINEYLEKREIELLIISFVMEFGLPPEYIWLI